jgi:antitoxin (DNA-binding transcriptional repressor) of toxin-antitoxin stability system
MNDRRQWLWNLGSGLGGMAVASLLASNPDRARAATPASAPLPPVAKAKRVIEIFCPGGLSHVDTWDYKPGLMAADGKEFDAELGKQTFAGTGGKFAKSFWEFRQHGQSGRWVSDLFPKLARHVDDMAFIYSMQNKSALHGPAMFMMNSGFIRPGFPTMGSWVTYGLGSENEDLPAFVVLPDPRGLPPGGVLNWGAGFLPAVHQGTVIEVSEHGPPIRDLFPADQRSIASEGPSRTLLQELNRQHLASRPEASLLEARIASFELAARLQLSAPEAIGLEKETQATLDAYAVDDQDQGPFGRQCLLARRLVERGVRFVQIFCGAENTSKLKVRPNWDSHEDIVRDHGYWGRVLDSGASALLADLKQRGLLDSTLVICTTEFGRQPFLQGQQKGRDHNPGAFTTWLAGGGLRGGASHGESDEVGLQAIEPTYCYDLHATALHLLGIDHERLTYYHNGIERRLTDVHGRVLETLLAST